MLIPSLGCLTSKQKWNFFLFCIWLWAKCSFSLKAVVIVTSWNHEPCITRSSQLFEWSVFSVHSCWWRIVVKHRETFAKSPTLVPDTVDGLGECLFLIPPLILYFLTNQLVIAFLTLVRIRLFWLGLLKYFLCSKLHEICEDFFVCINKNTYYISMFHSTPGHPLFSTLCFWV